MKAALVQCPGWGREAPPHALACLAAYARRHGHEVSCHDLNNALYHAASPEHRLMWDDKDRYSFWEAPAAVRRLLEAHEDALRGAVGRILDGGARVVGFTTHTTSLLVSLEVAGRIKRAAPDRLIVFGGPRCAREQEGQALLQDPRVDAVAVGEGEETLRRVLDRGALEPMPGLIVRGGDGGDPQPIEPLDGLPFPDYSDFSEDMRAGRYRDPRRLEVMDSRGCARSCHFCSEWQFWRPFRSMSGDRIFAEVRHQMSLHPGVSHFYFIGSLLNGDLRALERFCDLVISDGLAATWEGQAIVVPGMSRELLCKMARAGCRWLGYGIESGSERVRRGMNKRFTNAQALRTLRATADAGIKAQVNFMFGLPGETRADFDETLGFLKEARPFIDSVLASQSFCVVDKNTRLHRQPEEFGLRGVDHHLFWEGSYGNDYPERFRRYEEFCRLALSLGLPETSGVLQRKPDKWSLLGSYYEHTGRLPRAILCYRRAWRGAAGDETVRASLRRCYERLGRPDRTPAPAALALPKGVRHGGPAGLDAAPRPRFSARELNVLLNRQEAASGRERLLSTPELVTLGAHQACNASCIFCPQGEYPLFTLEAYRGFFEARLGHFIRGAQKLTFTGFGEVLLMPQAAEFLDHVNASLPDTEKILTTNGTPLRPAVVERLLEGRYSVQVSLHASRPDLHEELTGLKGRFSDIRARVGALAEARDRRGLGRRLHIELVTVLNTRNISDLPDFVRQAWELGAQSVRGLYLEVFAPEHLPLSCFFVQPRANEALERAEALAQELRRREPGRPFHLQLPPLFGRARSPQPSPCREPWQHVYVELQGSVLPCCQWGGHIGDIGQDDIATIWNSSSYRKLRRGLAGGSPHAWCRRCVRYAGYNVDELGCHLTNRPEARAAILKAAAAGV